jgi:hypothetical protein
MLEDSLDIKTQESLKNVLQPIIGSDEEIKGKNVEKQIKKDPDIENFSI